MLVLLSLLHMRHLQSRQIRSEDAERESGTGFVAAEIMKEYDA
jgi:hypothetical protein